MDGVPSAEAELEQIGLDLDLRFHLLKIRFLFYLPSKEFNCSKEHFIRLYLYSSHINRMLEENWIQKKMTN